MKKSEHLKQRFLDVVNLDYPLLRFKSSDRVNSLDDLHYANGIFLYPEDYLVVSIPFDEVIPRKLYHFTGSLNLIGIFINDDEVFSVYHIPLSLMSSILSLWK